MDIASLAFFRVAFGVLLLYEIVRYLWEGRVGEYWADPAFHFTLDPFGWVRPWPGPGLYIHWGALGLLAGLIALGWCYRAAMALFCLGFTYIFLLDEAKYLNHFYFICLVSLLMVFVPAHRAFSIDARRRPELRADTAPAWCLWVLRFQMGAVYFFGGVAKLNSDWLQGEPMRFWLARRADYPLAGPFFETELAAQLFTWGGLLFDLAVVPLLCWRRTRLFAFVWAVSFHLLNKWLLGVGIFPWFSIAATLLFFPSDWPRRVAGWFTRRLDPHVGEPLHAETTAARPVTPAALTRGEQATLALLAVFVAIQLFLPLRKHLYPGNVNWTEQGHNFAWHMKLRDKSATAQFIARFPATGETVVIDLEEWLTPRQIRKMPIRPRMILQFAHHLARELASPDRGQPEIRARVECRLNGRPPALLIDPEVDLAGLRPSLKPAPWILPLTVPLPSPEVTRRQAAYARRALDRNSLSREERRTLQRLEGD